MDPSPAQPSDAGPPMPDAVMRRLEDIEARLQRLEGRSVAPAARPMAPAPTPGLASASVSIAPPAPRMSRPPEAKPRPAPKKPAAARPASDPSRNIEQLIGGRWFLVLGALIVVVGVGFFLKLAYDQGWIGAIPPAARCLASAAFGFALMGVGRIAASRLGRFASTGFTAAGLGVLYATAYAAFAVFGLVGPAMAFGLLAGVCAVGLFTAVRAKSVTLSVLSLVGAYAAPVILARPDSPVWSLPLYLLALLAVASVLAVRHRGQRVLATLSWWGTGVLGTAWLAMQAEDAPLLAAGFVIAVWLAVHACRLAMPGAGETTRPKTARGLPRGLAGVASFSTTLWAVGAMLLIADWLGMPLWMAAAGFTVVTLAAGMVLAGPLHVLTDAPRNEREIIGVSLTAQAGALLPAAIMLGINTAWSQILIWALLGLGAAFAGRWARAASLAWYGGAILLLGIGRVAIEATGPLHAGEVGVVGLVFSWWMALAGLMGAACLAAAWLGRYTPDGHGTRPAARVLWTFELVAAGLVFAAMVLHEDATDTGLMLAYLLMAAAGLTVASVRPGPVWLSFVASAYAGLATMIWFGVFAQLAWFGAQFESPALLHPGLLWSLPLMAVWVWAGRAMRPAGPEPHGMEALAPRYSAWAVAAGLLLVATTLETARVAGMITDDATAQAGSVSIWWAVLATAALVIGFVRRAPVQRYAGIGLLLVATGKVLTWDLSQVSPAVRVLCFIGLGLVLLAVAAWYLRSAQRVEATETEPEAEPAEPGA